MPFGDGTGPMGYGSMTGRAAGYCAGYNMPGAMNRFPHRGWGGRQWAWNPWAPVPYSSYPSPAQELQLLKQQAETLQASLDRIHARIEELSQQKK